MKKSSYMIGIAVIMLAAAFALVPLVGMDADAEATPTAEVTGVPETGAELTVTVGAEVTTIKVIADSTYNMATDATFANNVLTITVDTDSTTVSTAIGTDPTYISWACEAQGKVKFTFADPFENCDVTWAITDESATATVTKDVKYIYNNINTTKTQPVVDGKITLLRFADVFPTVDKTYFQGWEFNGATYTEGSALPVAATMNIDASFKTFNITFKASAEEEDEGDVTVPTMDPVTPNTKIILPGEVNIENTLPEFDMSVDERQFIGWYVAGDEAKAVIAPGTEYVVTKDVKFIAVYNGGFEVTFVAGDTSTKSTSIALESVVKVSVPAKDGYTFSGWYDAKDVMAFKADGTVTEPAYKFIADTVLTAKFVPVNMTVTFIIGEQTTAQTVLYGQTAMAPALPEGYDAWLDADEEVFDFTTPVTTNITLTARAAAPVDPEPEPEPETPVYKLTFFVDNETYAETDTGALVIPDDPVKEGFEFKGWMVDGEAFDFKTPITKDTFFFATFEEVVPEVPVYTVTFMANDVVLIKVDTETFAVPEVPAVAGFEFLGWAVDGKIIDLETYTITEDTIFVAQYKQLTFTITFMDGDKIMLTQTVKYGEKAVLPNTGFVKWQTKEVSMTEPELDEDGNVVVEPAEVVTYTDYNFAAPVTGDLVLYGVAPVEEPGFFETPMGKCTAILVVFVLGFVAYAAYTGKLAQLIPKKAGGKKN